MYVITLLTQYRANSWLKKWRDGETGDNTVFTWSRLQVKTKKGVWNRWQSSESLVKLAEGAVWDYWGLQSLRSPNLLQDLTPPGHQPRPISHRHWDKRKSLKVAHCDAVLWWRLHSNSAWEQGTPPRPLPCPTEKVKTVNITFIHVYPSDLGEISRQGGARGYRILLQERERIP